MCGEIPQRNSVSSGPKPHFGFTLPVRAEALTLEIGHLARCGEQVYRLKSGARRSSLATLLVLLSRATGAIVVSADPRRRLYRYRRPQDALDVADVFLFVGLDSDDHLDLVLVAQVQKFHGPFFGLYAYNR